MPDLKPKPDFDAPPADVSFCDNCGHEAMGAYCSQCGQKTASFRRPIRHLGREVVDDYFGFDGRLWRTVVPLLTRPGFLTNAYLDGRRSHYIRPVRLYLSASVLLFFLISVLPGGAGIVNIEGFDPVAADSVEVGTTLTEVEREIAALDSARAALVLRADSLERLPPALPAPIDTVEAGTGFWEAFDETAEAKGDQLFEMGDEGAEQWVTDTFARNMPKAMFVLLPLFALLLKLLYARRSRYYGEHLVFALHTHAFAFIIFAALSVGLAVTGDVERLTGTPRVLVSGGALLLLAGVPAYVLIALRRVYRQGWIKTALKWAVLMIAYVILLALALVAVLVLSVLLL